MIKPFTERAYVAEGAQRESPFDLGLNGRTGAHPGQTGLDDPVRIVELPEVYACVLAALPKNGKLFHDYEESAPALPARRSPGLAAVALVLAADRPKVGAAAHRAAWPLDVDVPERIVCGGVLVLAGGGGVVPLCSFAHISVIPMQ
jgi:hypothetical protein